MAKDKALLLETPARKGPPERVVIDRGPDVGDLLGKCLLIERLGRGGTCTVFRALHQTLNVAVAVKVLLLDAGDAHRRAHDQLRTEARLLAQLTHPHIVRVLDFEDDPVLPFLVLECIEGPCLSELIQQSGRLSLERACAIIGETADALAALWQLGAVHRDVKPGNILLARDGVARLADFGQAVLIEEQEIADPDAPAPESPREDISGTAGYLAPEQFLNPASVDHRADLYSLGATFYHAVTGRMPFTGKSRLEVMMKHAQEEPVPPHEVVAGLSPAVSEVILTLMAKKPEDRYQEAAELLEALHDLTRPEAVEVGPEEESMAPAEAPLPRRSFWRSLLSAGDATPAPATPLRTRKPNEEWLQYVRHTLVARRDE